MKEQLGTSELKAGSAFQLNTSDLRSWSKSISVAERFANPRIDTITGEHYSDHDIEKMGYNHGELLGVTIIIEASIDKQHILVDFENIPDVILEHGHSEAEVVVLPGSYMVHVHTIDTHHHSSPNHFSDGPIYEIVAKCIKDYDIKPAPFEENLNKFPPNTRYSPEAVICMAMMYGFRHEDVTETLKHHLNGNSQATELAKKLLNYISAFHNSHSDPMELKALYRHFDVPASTRIHHDIEVDDHKVNGNHHIGDHTEDDLGFGDWEAE